jgi:hypothetical protein
MRVHIFARTLSLPLDDRFAFLMKVLFEIIANGAVVLRSCYHYILSESLVYLMFHIPIIAKLRVGVGLAYIK